MAAGKGRLPRPSSRAITGVIALAAALGVVQLYSPPHSFLRRPFAPGAVLAMPGAEPAPTAFGRSGAVQVRFALPGEAVEYPLAITDDTASLSYQWVRLTDAVPVDSGRALDGDTVTVPAEPGFYQLALVRGAVRRVLDEITVAVLVPFEAKKGPELNGYRIGTFLAERRGSGDAELPEGFVEVTPEAMDLPISKHLRLADFVTRDGQKTWPRYAAVSPRLLDKLELVVARIVEWRGDSAQVKVLVDVHSAFRTPFYNGYNRFARDSRHQYGDAADVAIDANGDGRLTASDAKIVADAVEAVENHYPDLVGGMGVYTSAKYNNPYVHIDARGRRARWRG